MEILLATIKAFLGHVAKKLLDGWWKPKEKASSSTPALVSLFATNVPCRPIAGVWLCQYKYPTLDDHSGEERESIETQLVRFEQINNVVRGTTIFALAHHEDFVGWVTKDRYFTGEYANKKNHHSYHGAFQFVISNSHSRMEGADGLIHYDYVGRTLAA
jgi:hypothetical protein